MPWQFRAPVEGRIDSFDFATCTVVIDGVEYEMEEVEWVEDDESD